MSLTPLYNMNPSAKEKYMEVFGPAEDSRGLGLFELENSKVCYREIISRPKGTHGGADKIILVNEEELRIEEDTASHKNWNTKYTAAEEAVGHHVIPGEKVVQANTYCDDDLLELLNDFYSELQRA